MLAGYVIMVISIVICLEVCVHIMVLSTHAFETPTAFHILAKDNWAMQWFLHAKIKSSHFASFDNVTPSIAFGYGIGYITLHFITLAMEFIRIIYL